MSRARLLLLALVVNSLSPLSAAEAQPVPAGPEFQVNTYTTSTQYLPSVASDGVGNFVVVWQGLGGGSDTGASIQGRRFDSTGAPLGSAFQVNTYTTGIQKDNAVASDSAGNFVAVWMSEGSAGSDTISGSIQARRFDNTGAPLGSQFQVNTYTPGGDFAPAVATDSAGNFVVVWNSDGSAGTDTSNNSIQARRFDNTGAPLGGQFQVNTYTTGNQWDPSVASDAAGNFVVVWRSTGSVGSDTSSYSIQGQRFDNAGASLGGQFQVNTYTTDMQWYPSVASDAAGNFVVVWESRGSVGSDTSSYSIQGQRFDNAGASLGGQFQVNTHTPSGQVRPSVASDAAGNFVVAWSGNTSAGSDTSYLSIQARRFDSTGAPQGGDFQVNTYTTSNQYASGVATDSAGKFVVVWDSDGSAGTDTSARSIQGQRFVMPTTSTSTSSTSTSSTSTSSTSTSSSSTSTSSTTLPNQTIAVIDQTGGSLTTPNGRVSINVPPGAVSGPTPFSITTGVSSGYGAGTTSRNLVTVVDLEPEGVTFSPPVTLTFSWPDANNNGRVDRVPPPGDTSLRERNLRVYRNGAVIPGTTICQSQVCAPAACCDMAANTWTVQVSQFSEWAVGTDPCVAVETSKLILKKVLPPSGDDKLTFIGTLTLPGPGTVADQLDVVNDGAVVRLVDGDTIVLDAEIPAGAYDTGTGTGWKVNGTNTKWTYIAPSTGGPGGIKRLKLLDKSATAPGLVKFIAKGSAGTYAAGIGVDPALVLPDAGQCYEATYPQTYPATPSCTATGGGTTIKCK